MSKGYVSFLDNYSNRIGEVIGLEFDEIRQIENKFKIDLPAAYIEFLSKYGKNSGYFLSSYLMTVDKLSNNKESALDASYDEIDDVKVEVKDSYFFFAQWQGYNFFFFDCSLKEDNPPVYILTDSPEIKKYKDSFTDFLRDEGLKPLLESFS